MEIKYTITYDTKLALRLFLRFFRKGLRTILSYSAIIAIYYISSPSPSDNCSNEFLFGFILIPVSIFVGVSWYWLKSIFNKKEEKPPVEYTLNDYGIHNKNSNGESKTKWEYVNEVDEIKDYLLLKMPLSLLPVPKSVLTPESTAWIKEKVGK